MTTRAKILCQSLLVGLSLATSALPAQATSIAIGDITASHLRITDTGLGTAVIDPGFNTLALATAQNSLGDLDAEADSEIGVPAATSATVTWAAASSASSGSTWSAQSSAAIPGATDGSANSSGQGILLGTLTVACPTCVGSTMVNLALDLAGDLTVMTDKFGVLAQQETILNLLIDGDTVLFRDDLLSIGSNDTKSTSFKTTLTNSMTLDYGTPYDVVLRTDSESEVINTAPEPATVTLLCLGLGAAGIRRARRRTSSAETG
jgi:hypothetical protein